MTADERDTSQNEVPLRAKRTVRRCSTVRFRVRCPLAWENLAPNGDADVRHCGVCSEDVFFCRTDEETIHRAMSGACIAREEPDGSELPMIVMGRPERPTPTSERQREAQRWRAREVGIREVLGGNIGSVERRCPDCSYPLPNWRQTCQVCGAEIGRVP